MNEIIKENVNLKNYTTFKIGGDASFFAEPTNVDEIIECLRFAKAHNLKYYFLGGGANTLVADNGVQGLVIYTGALQNISVDSTHIFAECGLSIDSLVECAIENGLSGTEFAYGLPGSVGGAVYMNARCYNNEFSSIVESVEVVDCVNEKVITLLNADINYQYKSSLFMSRDDLFIYKVTFNLSKANKSEIKAIAESNKSDRKNKGQYDYPSAGCIFKNNYQIGIPSGKLIQDAGLKNATVGGARVYEKHANFIINADNATAKDVAQLINHIEQTLETKGYCLEKEVRILGEINA